MPNLAYCCVPLVLVACFAAGSSFAQHSCSAATSFSADWGARRAYLALLEQRLGQTGKQGQANARDAACIKGQMIRLLEYEAKSVVAAGRPEAGLEDYADDYFADLITEVAAIHDPRAIDILVDPTVLGTGGIASKGLEALGHPALARMLREYASDGKNTASIRPDLISAATKMITNGSDISKADIDNIHALMRDGIKDRDWEVRAAAATGLGIFDNADDRKSLERMAAFDPMAITRRDGTVFYPVRVAALDGLGQPLPGAPPVTGR